MRTLSSFQIQFWIFFRTLFLILLLLIPWGAVGLIQPSMAQAEAGKWTPESQFNPSPNVAQAEFSYTVDRYNPSKENNPQGANMPGFRADNQLVIYTTAFGPRTQTAPYGEEAVVLNDTVYQVGTGNSVIPADGYVISGHGLGAKWIKNILKPGAFVTYDKAKQQLTVKMTTAVYLYALDDFIKHLELQKVEGRPRFQELLDQGKACRDSLREGDPPLTPAFIVKAGECQNTLNHAFYQTIDAKPGEFRGAWIRPSSANREEIRKNIAQLKALNIKEVFLETYYQGKTIFPSQVMKAYGLPEQHFQFKGTDPLRAWIEEAKANDIKVHAWFQTFFAGNDRESPETYGPILQKYPQWRNIERRYMAKTVPVGSDIEDGHYFLDPANPEVRQFMEKLILEVVTDYPLDGLNLDYIRYPASHLPNHPAYLASTWGYTDSAQALFQADMLKLSQAVPPQKTVPPIQKQAAHTRAQAQKRVVARPIRHAPEKPDLTLLDPRQMTPSSPYWNQWVQWRKGRVSSFVQNISHRVHEVSPNILISAVVFPKFDAQLALKLQDWPTWAKEGWIQALTPIGLSPTPEGMYKHSIQFKKLTEGKVPVYVGVFGVYNRLSPLDLLSQIDGVHRANMPGVVLFDGARITEDYTEALSEGPFRE